MSLLAKLAWPIQIAVFLLLLFGLPHTPARIFILFGYVIISALIVWYIRKNYA
jgi:hypothetical protein